MESGFTARVFFISLALFTVVASSARAQTQASKSIDIIDEDEVLVDAQKMKRLGTFKPSFYWIAIEPDDALPKTVPILDEEGGVIAMISDKFMKTLALEGTARLHDGRIVNFKTRIIKPDGTKEIRYRVCGPEAPFGMGYGENPLIPFKTLAVDTSVIPIGSRIYIPAARGALLPDGSRHDGYFHALDIGDAIQSKRIDVFTSFGDQSHVFGTVGMAHMKPVEVFLVK